MWTLSFYLISGLLIFSTGYCSPAQEPKQPTAPKEVAGWKDMKYQGVHSIGELLLHKGDSSQNEKLGVQVMDIIQPPAGAEGYSGEKKVVLRFFNAVNKQTLCEATFTEGGAVMGEGPPYPYCGPEVGLSGISVNAINTKDNWVWFDLRI